MTERNTSENPDKRFWPYSTMTGIMLTVSFAVSLFALCVLLKTKNGWPPDGATGTFLVVIAVISLIPIMLSVLDVVKAKGATIAYGDFRIDFSKVADKEITAITVPANIGTPGEAVISSGPVNIMNALKEATGSSIVVVDLEDGDAWWETRLVVLLAGANRLGSPDKIVFVANQSKKKKMFIGWAYNNDLLKCILRSDETYKRSFYVAKAVSAQWNLVESLYPVKPQNVQLPHNLPWMQREALNKQSMAFDGNTGLPNEFFHEQILQNELGREVELKEGKGRSIHIGRLNELFEPVLIKNYIDESSTNEEQTKACLADDHSHIAVVKAGIYSTLVSRYAVINEALKGIIK